MENDCAACAAQAVDGAEYRGVAVGGGERRGGVVRAGGKKGRR